MNEEFKIKFEKSKNNVRVAHASSVECPYRKYGVDGKYYCDQEIIAGAVDCPYLSEETIFMCEEGMPVLKEIAKEMELATERKLLEILSEPHMEDKPLCEYEPSKQTK